MRDHTKLRAFELAGELHYRLGLSKRLGYPYEREISSCESKIVEAEKVLDALLDQCADSKGFGN